VYKILGEKYPIIIRGKYTFKLAVTLKQNIMLLV